MSDAVRADTADRLLHAVADVQSAGLQPSLVAAVVRDGTMVWSGWRGSATGGPAPGTDVQYRIGSITKTVTAVLLMQCRDEGLVDLADPVSTVLGDVPFDAMTLRALLSHTGGLPAEPAGDWWERRDGGDFASLMALVGGQGPVLPAGRQHHYSNLAYALVGETVARLRGQPWFDAARERVLDPLGMRRTTYHPAAPHASGYSVHPWAGTLEPEPHTDTGAMAPAGQLWSTADDLARYLGFWLEPDPGVLAAQTVAEMRIPVGGSAELGLDAAYGLGLALGRGLGGSWFGHGGSMPGFLAGVAIAPEERTAAVALSNATVGETPALSQTLLDIVIEAEPRTPEPWEPESELAGADELLGPWYWGNTAFTMLVHKGHLTLRGPNPGRFTRFAPAGDDRWQGLDSYFTGETLAVLRAADGTVEHLDLATYTLTRTPYGRASTR